MALLLDLSNETLLEIIVYVVQHSLRKELPISEVCKRLNACCGRWIFQKYHLRLRTSDYYLDNMGPTNLDTAQSFKSWSLDAVMARISHFRDKAPYVKDLILEDCGNVNPNDVAEPERFPECIIPDLLDALREANQVVSIKVTCGYGGTLPLPLWEWITTKDLMSLKIGHLLAPPPNAMMHPKVRSFEGGLYKESMPFLDLIQPESILLDFSKFYRHQPQISSYKPSGSQLRKVVLTVNLPEEFEKPLLDFSCVPEARIRATFYLGVEYKFHIPGTWQRLKTRLPAVFAEGLDKYDVARPSMDDVYITRGTLADIEAGWKPKNAVHLEGVAEAREEQEQMNKYYAYKTKMYWNY